MDNSSQSLSVYCRKRCSCSGTEQSSKLKCNESTLGLMKLHGRWQIICGLCILRCLLVKTKQLDMVVCLLMVVWFFLYDGLVFAL